MSFRKADLFINSLNSKKNDQEFYDLFAVGSMFTPEELARNQELAEQAILLNRNSLRGNGYTVEALNKKSRLKKQAGAGEEPGKGLDLGNNAAEAGQDGLNLEAHPELPYSGGKIDQIILPESEVDNVPEELLSETQRSEKAKKKQKQAKELQAKLKLANRMRYTNAPAAPQPKYKPAPRSRPLPRPGPPV